MKPERGSDRPAGLPTVVLVVLITAGVVVGIPAAAPAGSLAELYRTGTVDLELSLELGGDEVEDDDAVIFAPGGFAVDGEGFIYISAARLYCVKKFDPSGGHVLTFGREGEGPGEFRHPSHIVIDGEGRLVVFDFQNKRFQAFTADGEYLDAWSIQDNIDDIEPAPGGGYYVGVNEFDFMDPEGLNDLKLVWMSGDFGESRTIDSTRVRLWEQIVDGTSVTMATLPFPPYLHWALLPDGRLVVGRSDEYRLDILSPEYKKTDEITRDVEAPAVTESDKTEHFAMFERDGRPGLSPAMKNKMDFPGRKPYFDDIVVDWDGNLLVRCSSGKGGDADVYDTFDGAGVFIGRVEIEGLSAGAVFRDGFVYTRHRAEDALPTVRRYRIPGVSADGAGKP